MAVTLELIGKVLDEKYRIEKQIGKGGMGTVYLTTHIGTDRPVALKIIAPQLMASENSIERFKREAKATGRLRHPNVVNVTDFGFTTVGSAKVAYLVMEYLDGCSLKDLLKKKSRLQLEFVIDIVEQICLAIDEAHKQGIIHRDLKPDNIWLETNGRGGYNVKVLDFGVAKLRNMVLLTHPSKPVLAQIASELNTIEQCQNIDTPAPLTSTLTATPNSNNDKTANDEGWKNDEAGLTYEGALIGTPRYMSPEQCLGEKIDERSDIYSLGVIVFQMLAGESPFQGDMGKLMNQHITASPPSLIKKRPDIPQAVAELITSALAKNPSDRPATAAAFASSFRARAEGLGTVLRNSLAIYGTNFTTLFKISLIGYLPYLAIYIILSLLSHSFGLVSKQFQLFGRTFEIMDPVEGGAIALLAIFTLTWNKVAEGLFAPIIAQYLNEPLRPVIIPNILLEFKKNFLKMLKACLNYYLRLIGGFLLLIIPGLIIYAKYTLLAPVVIMEDKKGKALLKRSRTLFKRIWLPIMVILFLDIYFNSYIHLPGLNLPDTLANSFCANYVDPYIKLAGLSQLFATIINQSIRVGFTILVRPFISSAIVLYYFKTRQFNGETLQEILSNQSHERVEPRHV